MPTTDLRHKPVVFYDVPRVQAELAHELNEAVVRVMQSGRTILGPEVEAFEAEWAAYCGAAGAAAVGNGTDALALALTASGAVRAGRGDEVITTPLTSGYTGLAILNAGGVPVFADVDPASGTLDAAAVEAALTPRTRAIVPVHLYGQMADMDAICAVAERHKLVVVEDAAHAHGATAGGRPPGAIGHAAAFSFYPTKNLGALGDAGAVVSRDPAVIERVKILRQGGHEPAMAAAVEGRNSRMDELQAAILRVKLKYLAEWNERRRTIAHIYDVALGEARAVRTFPTMPGNLHARHLYVIRHSSRDDLRAHLTARGIETLIHYPYLLHRQQLFQSARHGPLHVAETIAPGLLSLPLYPQLRADEAEAVAAAVRAF